MMTNRRILVLPMVMAAILLLAVSATVLADSFTNVMIIALGLLLSFVATLVLFFARNKQEVTSVSVISKARAPRIEIVQNIHKNSINVVFGINVKERMTRIIRSSSMWRQDRQGVMRC